MGSGGARPGSGRRPTSDKLKKLRGTDRKDRSRELTVAGDGPMICPMHLGELEQLLFGSIADILEAQERASPHYAEHVALLAQRLGQIQRWQAVLEVEGDTYETATATGGIMIRKRPEVQMLSDAMRHAQSLLGELMLNPAAALRLAEGHKDEGGDFDDF